MGWLKEEYLSESEIEELQIMYLEKKKEHVYLTKAETQIYNAIFFNNGVSKLISRQLNIDINIVTQYLAFFSKKDTIYYRKKEKIN